LYATALRETESLNSKLQHEKQSYQENQSELVSRNVQIKSEVNQLRNQLREALDKVQNGDRDANELQRDNDRLKIERKTLHREIERLKAEIHQFEHIEEKKRHDEIERLKHLETAFGSYVRGALATNKPGI
jgi:transposase